MKWLVLSLALLVTPPAGADYLLQVWEKGITTDPLLTKRYISVFDCRDERDFLFEFNHVVEGNSVWITCSPEEL